MIAENESTLQETEREHEMELNNHNSGLVLVRVAIISILFQEICVYVSVR